MIETVTECIEACYAALKDPLFPSLQKKIGVSSLTANEQALLDAIMEVYDFMKSNYIDFYTSIENRTNIKNFLNLTLDYLEV
jgi:hypothetical protein